MSNRQARTSLGRRITLTYLPRLGRTYHPSVERVGVDMLVGDGDPSCIRGAQSTSAAIRVGSTSRTTASPRRSREKRNHLTAPYAVRPVDDERRGLEEAVVDGADGVRSGQ